MCAGSWLCDCHDPVMKPPTKQQLQQAKEAAEKAAQERREADQRQYGRRR